MRSVLITKEVSSFQRYFHFSIIMYLRSHACIPSHCRGEVLYNHVFLYVSFCNCCRQCPHFCIKLYSVSSLPFSDGCGRTGTFLSIYSQIERLKTEQVIDVFQWVKSSRIQRPWLVSNQVKIIMKIIIFQYALA